MTDRRKFLMTLAAPAENPGADHRHQQAPVVVARLRVRPLALGGALPPVAHQLEARVQEPEAREPVQALGLLRPGLPLPQSSVHK